MSSVRIKAAFGQMGRAIKASDARPAATATPITSRVARQLALAYWIEQRIESGELRDLADAARALGLTRARVSQLSNLRLLPSAVQEAVLTPGYAGSERQLRAHAPTGGVGVLTVPAVAESPTRGSAAAQRVRRFAVSSGSGIHTPSTRSRE
jgi:hypothetical protein